MDIISIILITVMAAGMMYFVVMMFVRIIGNMNAGNRFRQALTEEVQSLPLSRMLTAAGVDMDRYTHKESVVNIRTHIAECKQCEKTDECEDMLNSHGFIGDENIDFCRNSEAIHKMDREQH